MQQDSGVTGQVGACVSRFLDVLRDHGGRFTQERGALLDLVLELSGHFTPEEVAALAAKRGQPIAVTTVYRNLPLFIEAGIVRRAPSGEHESAHYEVTWNRARHDHLACTRCGKQVEFHSEAVEQLRELMAREFGFELAQHSQTLVGLCPACAHGANGPEVKS